MKTFRNFLAERQDPNDIMTGTFKGTAMLITNGIETTHYKSANYIGVAALMPPMKSAGRLYNPIVRALEAAGADAYFNKQYNTILISKDERAGSAIKSVLRTTVPDSWTKR